MIQIVPQMKILVALESVDGRKGIDSLARLCQEKLQRHAEELASQPAAWMPWNYRQTLQRTAVS